MIENVPAIVFAAILGACLGSFANVAAIRLHDMSSLMGRSQCPACRKAIRARHLVPIFSWLALRGRCADCGADIHVQYPLVETSAAVLTVIAALRSHPFGPEFPQFYFEVFLSVALLVIVVMDLRWKELPVELMVLVGLVGAGWHIAPAVISGAVFPVLLSLLYGSALGVAFFGIQWALSRGAWLGSGDVWFGAMIGLVLGWPLTAAAIYTTYILGGSAAMAFYFAGFIKRGDRVPFAPALALGLLCALWFGEGIVGWAAALY